MHFEPVPLTAVHDEWRRRVRAVVDEHLGAGRRPVLGMTGGHDPAFSAALGDAGLAGLAIPTGAGGRGCTSVARFVVTEELLAAGAPITAHWGADRQVGPNLVAFGTADQRAAMMPSIVRGELFFSLGMSEPDAGSDLASVRTTGTRADGGWLINGTKIWTSYADRNHYFVVLCRTSSAEDRHSGLSQVFVDLAAPGVEIRPIGCLDPHHHFHEVVMTDVFVPDEMVLGEIGHGWSQVTAELTLERAGPDRYMTVVPLLRTFVRSLGPESGPAVLEHVGSVVARLWMIRHLSLSTSGSLDHGRNPAVEAALVKDLGSRHEQETVETIRRLHGRLIDPDSDDLVESLLAEAMLAAPSYTIRGGTVEILRSVAAKGLRVAGGRLDVGDDLTQHTVERLLADHLGAPAGRGAGEPWSASVWDALAEMGAPWIGVPDAAGGSGGTAADAAAIIRLSAYAAAPVPLPETIAAASLLAAVGLDIPGGPLTISGDVLEVDESEAGLRVRGSLRAVPWGRVADRVVCVARGRDDRWYVVALPPSMLAVEPGHNIAGEPRDSIEVDTLVDDAELRLLPAAVGPDVAARLIGSITALKISGACQAATDLAVGYASERRQFGQPIGRFQAVQHHLVRAAGETALATMGGLIGALVASPAAAAAARVVAARAAREVSAACHQVHGAIGMTTEYPLHLWTRRLWAWSDEGRTESAWAHDLGSDLASSGDDRLWEILVTGPPVEPSSFLAI